MPSYITRQVVSKLHINHVMRSRKSGGSSSSGSGVPQGGNGSISGVVLEKDVPVARRVMLYERATGAFVAKTWSDADGNYKFNRTNESNTYFVIALDENKDDTQYNLVGQDLISGNYDGVT